MDGDVEFKKEYIFGIVALIVAIAFWWFYFRKPSIPANSSGSKTLESKNKVVIYGSLGCPYTVKQMEKFPDHEFVDCTSQKCPDFVTAYPTTKMPDGRIEVGFS